MNIRMCLLPALLALLAGCGQAKGGQPGSVRLIDGAGRPLAGTRVQASSVTLDKTKTTLVTDRQGYLDLTDCWWFDKKGLVRLSADGYRPVGTRVMPDRVNVITLEPSAGDAVRPAPARP